MEKKFVGTINIGSGVNTNLKFIAKVFAKKLKKGLNLLIINQPIILLIFLNLKNLAIKKAN